MNTKPGIIEYYDGLIWDPLHRAYWGDNEFYNVGFWTQETNSQTDACQHLIDCLLDFCSSPQSVLDVGCGLGATTQRAKQRWPDASVHGINISKNQINYCLSKVENCNFRIMDAARLDFVSDSFDFIFSAESAFHFDTREEFLKEAYRVLRPGGSIAIADILLEDNQDAAKLYLWDVQSSNHLSDLAAYIQLLESVGFQSIAVNNITNQSWLAWCSAIEKWLECQAESDIITSKRKEEWRLSLPWLRRVVSYYITAFAIKPPNKK